MERQPGSRLREGFEAERGGHARQQLRNVAHVVDVGATQAHAASVRSVSCAGVQHKNEDPITEDDNPADLDSILDRIAPEKREAILKSRAKLMNFAQQYNRRHKGDAELLSIVLHLDNFAAVIDGITIGLSPRSENARDIDTPEKRSKRSQRP
jgi:hypothetical protein